MPHRHNAVNCVYRQNRSSNPHAGNKGRLNQAYAGTYLSQFGSGFQVLLQATEGRIVVLQVCAGGLAAAAAQIAGHVMRNVVVVDVVLTAGTAATGKDPRLRLKGCGFDRIACLDVRVACRRLKDFAGHLCRHWIVRCEIWE